MPKGNGVTADEIAIERELPCRLTDDELRMRGDAMADAELLVDMLKAERRAVNKKIFAATDNRNKLAHVIDDECESRIVVCKWIGDLDQNLWTLIRQDTGECVEQRAMTAADRQGSLPYGPANPGGLPEGDEHGEVHADELAKIEDALLELESEGLVERVDDDDALTDAERQEIETIEATRPKPFKRKPRSIAAAKSRAKPGKAKSKTRRAHA
jgi:hypothetical protein